MTMFGRRAALAGALALVTLTGCVGDGDREPTRPTSAPPVISGPGSCREDAKFDGGNEKPLHKTGVEYKINPPAGGDHDPRPVPPGIYKRGEVPDGAIVHAMEHGDVVLWHTALDPGDEAKLHEIAKRFPKVVLVVPRRGMDAPIVATRWQKRLLCQGLDVEALSNWIEANKNKGPEVFPE